MRRLIAIIALTLGLAGCGVVNTLVDGFKYAKAVETDLEKVTGLKPGVGFSWKNGRLVSVTVSFPKLYESKPLAELAEQVRVVVAEEFKQTPDQIVLSFNIPGTAPGKAARSDHARTSGG